MKCSRGTEGCPKDQGIYDGAHATCWTPVTLADRLHGADCECPIHAGQTHDEGGEA